MSGTSPNGQSTPADAAALVESRREELVTKFLEQVTSEGMHRQVLKIVDDLPRMVPKATESALTQGNATALIGAMVFLTGYAILVSPDISARVQAHLASARAEDGPAEDTGPEQTKPEEPAGETETGSPSTEGASDSTIERKPTF